MAKKRQKIILVPLPSLLLLPLLLPSPSPSPLLSLLLLPLLATPAKPMSVDEVNEDKDKNIKEPIKVENKNIGSSPPLPPPPTRFISV